MKNLTVIIEKGKDGYFVGTVPAIPGCHTQAKTVDKLMERIKEAVELCIECGAQASERSFFGVTTLHTKVGKHALPSPA